MYISASAAGAFLWPLTRFRKKKGEEEERYVQYHSHSDSSTHQRLSKQRRPASPMGAPYDPGGCRGSMNSRVPSRMTLSILRQRGCSWFSASTLSTMPAAVATTSTLPKSRTICAKVSFTCASWVTSQAYAFSSGTGSEGWLAATCSAMCLIEASPAALVRSTHALGNSISDADSCV